jgi:hypothetical protein
MMRLFPVGIVVFFLISPAAALHATETGYDLKCQGNSSALDNASAEMPASPFAMTLHVDLEHNSFCQDGCETREKISKVLPSNIIFRAVNAPWPNRLWVADTGQFSYTWADVGARDTKPSVYSAQGTCIKVIAGSASAVEVRPKPSIAASKLTVPAQKPVNPDRPEELTAPEITALIDIQNRRPVPASMHTRLYARGLVHLDNDLWVLTDRGEAIITGDRR